MCCEDLVYKLPQVDNCCCCCKVETGSKILGWLAAVGAFIYTIFTIIGIVALAVGANHAEKPDDAHAIVITGIVFASVMLIVLVFMWAMAIVLLVGLYKEDMGKVKLWLRVNICLFIFGLVSKALSIVTVISTGKANGGEIAVNIISAIISALISVYFLAVVKSHYMNKTQGIQAMRG